MADPLFELVMNRNPMIKTRNHGILTVNITSDGKIRIRWGDREATLSPEKALRFFNGCVALAEVARRLSDVVDWSKYWDRKLGKTRASKTKPRAARRARPVEEEPGEEEEEVEEAPEEGEVEVL